MIASARDRRDVDWIICQDSGATGKCLRCGQKISVVLPMVLTVWCVTMKAFIKLHRRCKKRPAMSERCEGITASGEQCKCYATERVNEIPYCRQHAAKELRALASEANTKDGGAA